jgi:hypothetical protein
MMVVGQITNHIKAEEIESVTKHLILRIEQDFILLMQKNNEMGVNLWEK